MYKIVSSVLHKVCWRISNTVQSIYCVCRVGALWCLGHSYGSHTLNRFYFGLHVFCVIFTVFQFSATVWKKESMESIKFASKHLWFWIQFFARRQIWQQMALAWKLHTVIGYNDKQCCPECCILYFVVHCVMVDWKSSYTCLQVVLFEGKICFCCIF